MAYFDPNIVNEIRKKADIVEIISGYIPLTKRGKNFFGVCPFHDDNNPSMSVSSDKQIYKCFSCGATGNVFKFIADYEHISFREAIVLLGNKYDFQLDNSSVKKNVNTKEIAIYDLAVKFYQNNINTTMGKSALKYLADRQIDEITIKKFQIGLATSNGTLTELLTTRGYNLDELIDLGLTTDKARDVFVNRIIFPLHNLSGEVVGFSGRIYNTHDDSKYVNTKETRIFKKGEILYNYYLAREHLQRNDKIIIMEGFMDVIRASTIGIDNCVATMGTAMTKQQAMLIKKMANNVILCFDGDKAGEKATIAGIEILSQVGVVPQIVRLEQGLDPDEYILKYGLDAFKNKISNPLSVFTFKHLMFKASEKSSDIKAIAIYLEDALKQLAVETNDLIVDMKLSELAAEFNVMVPTLKQKYLNYKNQTKTSSINIIKQPQVIKNNNQSLLAERGIIYLMLYNESVISKVENEVSYIPDDNFRYLFNEIIAYYHKYNHLELADFMTSLIENEKLLDTLNQVIQIDKPVSDVELTIEDYIRVINKYNIDSEIKRIEKQLQAERDPIKQGILLDKINEIRGVS